MGRVDLTGNVLDERYRVIESIGAGAMGSVYRGERIRLGRPVAIKVLNENIANDASRRRFEREAMAMAKLEHPNCGTVLDVGMHDGRPYVVMEFVSGQNLKEVLGAGPLPVARAVEITRQVLSGLSHAHEHGIIHRDIKPANVMVSQKAGVGDHVKILDFGLARSNHDKTNLTGAMVLGTPSYMAPEQIRGGQIDHRVDLYACGVMLFELLTGAKPFHAEDPMAVCMQHLNFAAPKLADRAPGRSFGALEAVVARALAKDPAQRFASAEEFSRALVEAAPTARSAAGAPEPTTALTPPAAADTVPIDPAPILAQTNALTVGRALEPARPRRRMVAIASGGLGLAAAAAAIAIATRSDAGSTRAPASMVLAAPAPAEPLPATSPTDEAAAPTPPAEPPPAAPAEPPPATPAEPPPATALAADPADQLVARATDMAAAGRREAALDLLLRARKTYPKNARVPYEASKLYFDKLWWADGLKQARAAIRLDPSYRTDAELIKLVLKGFNTTARYDWSLAKFLREDIGPAAKPFLEETAASHPNPIVRKRAARELKRYR